MIDTSAVNNFFSWQFWAFFGIVLEIVGFVLMTLLWGKHPKMDYYQKWTKEHKSLMDEWRPKMNLFSQHNMKKEKKWYNVLPWSIMYIDDVEKDQTKGLWDVFHAVVRYQEVPNRFMIEWVLKTKALPITPVIVGLVFQGYQLIKF